jgi:hypothetical protein
MVRCFFSEKESATLANRLIEGQVLNAQYAEESYQLKRENATLKKQLGQMNNQTIIENNHTNPSDFNLVSNNEELESLRETVERLSDVSFYFIL